MTSKMYFAVLLPLINFSVLKIAFCENVQLRSEVDLDKIKTTADFQHHEMTGLSSMARLVNKAQIQEARFRREIKSRRRNQCGTPSQCTRNDTLFENLATHYNCYCDNACYETFQDCCSDFVKTCGEQKKTNTKNSQRLWKCLAVGDWNAHYQNVDTYCRLNGPSGIWMIANCSRNWALDETRTRCENAPEKFSFPVEDFLPVVGKNGFTYRNKHCAECNKETSYESWDILVTGSITPPKEYKLDDKLRFLLANAGFVRHIGPGGGIPRRYCAGARYVDSCPDPSHPTYQRCLDGPIETVGHDVPGFGQMYFKNKACWLCHASGETISFGKTSEQGCGGHIGTYSGGDIRTGSDGDDDGDGDGFPISIWIVFNADKQTTSESTVNQAVTATCPKGMVYDDISEYCRKGVVTDIDDTLSDLFFIALWFEPPPLTSPFSPLPLMPNITKHLKSSLVKKFALKSNQLTAFQFHPQNSEKTLLVATFHLKLTPYQEFILANKNNNSNLNISNEALKFLGLLKFTTNFTMQSGGYRFPVIKLVSKQLACFQGRTLQSHEYEHDNISGNVTQKSTGKVFSKSEYKILWNIGGNITICRSLVLSGCHDGAFVTLYEHEYFVYKNLTIFHYPTNRTFNFGEYQIIEAGSSNRTNADKFQNASFPRNSTVRICLPLRQTFNTTEKIKVFTKSDTDYPLRILTMICFSISIMFLFILLVTYWMFNELRTLPGLNLMSLAVSMLLSQVIWLVGTAQFMNTKTCEVLGIIEHYLFLVTFMAMSVISYHSCIVFSRPFGRSSNNIPAQFAKYSSIAWISPAIFITVCVTLDQTEATFDIYGTTCWLSTGKAVLYLFILPAAVIMLFNIITFIKTALALCNNDTKILRRDRKQNLIACTKLATLVCFPWLFAFFGVIFPDTEAFEYLFVVFACLQGFYMGVAFVCNKKTIQLYRNWWDTTHSQSSSRDGTFEML